MRPRSILTTTAVLIALAASACSSDDTGAAPTDAADPTSVDSNTATTFATEPGPDSTEPEPEPESVTTEPAPGSTEPATTLELPATPVVAVLDQAYDFQGGTPDASTLPVGPGTVEAHWYRAGDVLAVVYVGLEVGVESCPGNSALTSAGFEFASNATLAGASCEDLVTFVNSDATQGVQICGGVVGYLTLIPSDVSGQVFASVERPLPDFVGVGVSGAAMLPDANDLPEIDPTSLAC